MSANRKRLNEANVLTLQLKPKTYRVWDRFDRDSAPGLHALVQPSGTKSYRVIYKLDGQSLERSVQVGRVGEVTLKQARAKAREVRALAADGTDIKSSDPKRSETFKSCVEHWVKDRTAKKPRVSDEKVMQFVLGSTKAWHDRAVRTIRPKEIETLLADKRDNGRSGRGAKYAAVQLYTHLRTLFAWLAKHHNVEPNPMLKVEKPWQGAQRRERTWFHGTHADDAIVKLWRLAERVGGDRGKFLQLLIVTGKRRATVENMKWQDIDRDWYWRPPQRSKSKKNIPIVLPQLARQILGGHRYVKGRVLFVDQRALAKDIRDNTDLEGFIFHGVRHVIATKLKELRVDADIRRLVCDHEPYNDVHADYEHGDYREEMLEASERWCSHVQRLIGENVMPLKRAG
jgi:integrase